jgi:hypothetical protein
MKATLQDATPHPIARRVAVPGGAHSHVTDVDVVEMLAAIKQFVASNAERTVFIGFEVNSAIVNY